MIDVTGTRGGRRAGALSVKIALVAILITAVAVAAFYLIPETAAGWDVALWIIMAIFFAGAPVAHVVGFCLGIAATFRADDRRGLGALGAGLNALALAIGGSFVYLGAAWLASR